MSRIKLFSVGQLAKRTGITVRTLHHYDEIGLLVPAARSSGARRLYDSDDVLRLQQILTYRTLGLPREEIRRLLDDPAFDRRSALIQQRQAVVDRIAHSQALIRGIDEALTLIDSQAQKEMDMTALFGGFDPAQFEEETQQRWGETAAWRVSDKRTSQYTDADWQKYHMEHRAICSGLADLAARSAPPDGPEALSHAKAYADLIDRWFYPCDAEHLGRLAAMYEEDARFRQTFDAYGAGTAAFVIAAFQAYAQAGA